ncbi:MAG: DUF2141 domain-containing protein [Verrucomicrobiota bacterium]
MMKLLPCLACLALTGLSATPATAIDVTVTVKGIRNDKGKIAALAFSSKPGFPDDVARAIAKTVVDARQGSVTLTLKDLPPGPIAITVLHDEDSNGKLKRNLFGIPLEGVGMSRNPFDKHFPTFADATLDMRQSNKIDIMVKYW